VGIKYPPSGCRSSGWDVLHLVGVWAEFLHDLKRADVAVGKFLARSLFQLLPPDRDQIPWTVLLRFPVFGIVVSFLSRLIGENVLTHLAPDAVPLNFWVAIFWPREIGFDW
jgi:hypothetical protein